MAIRDSLAFNDDPRWSLVVEGFDRSQEQSIETVMSLVNGYCGTRATLDEGSTSSYPGTFVAGVFNTPATPQGDELEAPIPEIVIAPNWSRVRLLLDGQELILDTCELLEQRRALDLRQGLLVRDWRIRDQAGRTTALRSVRFASLADRHVLVQILMVTPENYSGSLQIESLIDAAVTNANHTVHLQPAGSNVLGEAEVLRVQTIQSDYELVFVTQSVLSDDLEALFAGEPIVDEQLVGRRFVAEAKQGETLTLCKYVALFTSRDGAHPGEAAESKLRESVAAGAAKLLSLHADAWAERWRDCDAEIAGDETVQREVRWALYHLNGAAWPGDEHSSVGARSLTGERYRGHVFWDTETFVWPFFCYTWPQTARSLLMYRYHTLDGARAKAQSLGYRGALYPWEATDTGEETTPPWIRLPNGVRQQILTGEQEHHLAADIAYAVLQYRQATNDDEFFFNYGAEMVLEIARFWSSRAYRGDDGAYHIDTVIGPDEYHEFTNDGAYTNVMASWTLEQGLAIADEFAKQHPERWAMLSKRLALEPAEMSLWRDVAEHLTILFDPGTGLFEQFRGYHQLEEVDLTDHDMSIQTMDIALGWERLQKTKILKQADVVLLLFLLWDRFDERVRRANFSYYEPRTSHDSSLSASIHGLVAARLGEVDLAEMYVRKAARIDLDFGRKGWAGATGGVHIAALGGIWQALAFGFLGMRPQNDGVRFAATVPATWGSVQLSLRYRGSLLHVSGQASGALAIRLEDGLPLQVAIGDGAWSLLTVGESLSG